MAVNEPTKPATEISVQVTDLVCNRLKNPFWLSFVIAFLYVNWYAIFTFIYDCP